MEIKPCKVSLYLVDVQNDFMNSDGALYVPGAKELIPDIVELAEQFSNNPYRSVFASMDWHDDDSEEFVENGGPFPSHCLMASYGAQLINRLQGSNLCRWNIITKSNYDVFTESLARSYFDNPKKASVIFVAGVATEYCVKAAVMGLLSRGHMVVIVKDAIAGANTIDALTALKEMADAGAHICRTSEVDDLSNMLMTFGKVSAQKAIEAISKVNVIL